MLRSGSIFSKITIGLLSLAYLVYAIAAIITLFFNLIVGVGDSIYLQMARAVVAACCAAVAIGLLRLRAWARNVTMVILCIYVVSTPIVMFHPLDRKIDGILTYSVGVYLPILILELLAIELVLVASMYILNKYRELFR